MQSEVGKHFSAHATSLGKVLLSRRSASAVLNVLTPAGSVTFRHEVGLFRGVVCPPPEVVLFAVWESPILKGYADAQETATAEAIVAKLRQVDVLTAQGKTVAAAVGGLAWGLDAGRRAKPLKSL
jgi:hypothetical protein